jgi:hypothetical protein
MQIKLVLHEDDAALVTKALREQSLATSDLRVVQVLGILYDQIKNQLEGYYGSC